MFQRFTGTAKPKTTAETTVDTYDRMTKHMNTLDTREASIQQKIDVIESKLAELKKQIANSKGSRQVSLRNQASTLLKQRKMYMSQLSSVTNMNLTMGQTLATMQNVDMMKDQMEVMQQVSAAQSDAFKQLDLNKFMDLTDRMQDMREDMDDVNAMMMESMVGDNDLDEDELDQELADLALDGQLPVAATSDSYITPAAKDNTKQENIDDALSRL